MQIRVRDKKTYFWWSVYIIGRWFVTGIVFILAGVMGKMDLRLGLLLGGGFGIVSVLQWHRLSVWRRQQEKAEAVSKISRQ